MPANPTAAADNFPVNEPYAGRIELRNDGLPHVAAVTVTSLPFIPSVPCGLERTVRGRFYFTYVLNGDLLTISSVRYRNLSAYSTTLHEVSWVGLDAAVADANSTTLGWSMDLQSYGPIQRNRTAVLASPFGVRLAGSYWMDGKAALFVAKSTDVTPATGKNATLCAGDFVIQLGDFARDSGTLQTTTSQFDVEANAIRPFRAYDSRSGWPGRLGNGSTRCVKVAGRNGVPYGAAAVSVNVTAVGPRSHGHVTVYPNGMSRPNTSNLNFAPNEVVANSTTVKVGLDDKICVYARVATDIVLDVTAYYPTRLNFAGGRPNRVYDSGGALQAGQTVCPVIVDRIRPAGASINVTVVGATRNGHARIYEHGQARPGTSNVNLRAGQTRATEALINLSSSNRVCVYAHSGGRLIIDVNGYFPYAPTFFAQGGYSDSHIPSRLFNRTVAAGSTTCVTVAGTDTDNRPPHYAPGNADRVVVGLVMVGADRNGNLRAFANGQPRPPTSTLNYTPGTTVANSSVVDIGSNRKVCVYSTGAGRLIIDLQAYQRS